MLHHHMWSRKARDCRGSHEPLFTPTVSVLSVLLRVCCACQRLLASSAASRCLARGAFISLSRQAARPSAPHNLELLWWCIGPA